jgi:predicted metallopeptidase
MFFPFFQNQLVVICLELKHINNVKSVTLKGRGALRYRWNSANLFWKFRTSGTFLSQLLCRHILAGNC